MYTRYLCKEGIVDGLQGRFSRIFTMSALASLTDKQKHKAFLKAREEVKLDDGCELVRVTEEHYDKVLQFLGDHYITDEPLHNIVGVTWNKEAYDMQLEPVAQNISLMIVNSQDNGEYEIMALLTNQVVKKGELHGEGGLEDVGLKNVWDFIGICEKKAKLFDHFNVKEAVQLVSLVTSRKYRQRGYGKKVLEASIAMIRHFGIGKVCVKGEGSSLFTQKIFEGAGMKALYKGVYKDYEVDGKKVFEGTGIHDSIIMYGMMVDSS